MKKTHMVFAAGAGAMMALGAAVAQPVGGVQGEGGGGADAGLCQLISTRSWGRVGDTHAFSIRTDTWNIGEGNLVWEEFTPVHPLMVQNLYRYREGRIEQIGLSWIKHGFCALQQAGCGDCFVQAGCLDFLGPGCRDPYSANLNGNQTRLGPRSEVNASSGAFPYPFTLGWQQTGDAVYKRIQVRDADINPAMNPGARYYIEGQIMHVQEGTSGLRHNNATHEEVTPAPNGDTFLLGNGFNTVQLLPAIYAWQANDPGVVIEAVDAPGTPVDGRLHVAYRVFDNGDGTWRYEYAVHNLNSHRSAQAFAVPRGPDSSVLSTFHRDVKYHSGAVYTNEDWTLDTGSGAVSWSGMTFDQNPNANALRWGTMFNFALVSDAAPQMGKVKLTFFRPGGPPSVEVAALVPTGAVSSCPADLNGDGSVDLDDLQMVLESRGSCPPPPAVCRADLNGDGTVNGLDVKIVTQSFGPCP
jgi:hypothetical protein